MDIINGCFELFGGFFICLSIVKAHRDKCVRGVSWAHAGFFTVWGWWNLLYYPSLGQWVSFVGGIVIVVCNSVWLGQLIYYSKKNA